MRALVPIAAITFAGLFLLIIGAHADGTWCRNNTTNCGFYSFEQCQASRSGNAGFCTQNPFSAYGYAGQSQRRYRRDR
jgi:hypothetical protein